MGRSRSGRDRSIARWQIVVGVAAGLILRASAASARGAPAAELPACHERHGAQRPAGALPEKMPDRELLARLVNAEATSTGFPDDPLVHRAIAWGVMNRVRLGAASRRAAARYGGTVRDVVTKPGQFNPAMSPRSRFSAELLCPRISGRFTLAASAAVEALGGTGNPFVATAWEKATGLSLVVSFYYPSSEQARGPLAPWEGDPSLVFVGDVLVDGHTLPASRVRFYRLAEPPGDVAPARATPRGEGEAPTRP